MWRPCLLSLVLLGVACAPKVPPEDEYRFGNRESALEAQKLLAGEPGKEQALHSVRLASMALAEGDRDLAETALRVAVSRMQDFQAEGEFQALLIKEEAKEWKGEPYEKMAAFFTLGMLLYQEGDIGNALAMFKSAIIADAGTTQERYRSDFVPAYVMQALAYQSAGEKRNAETAMGRAIDAIYARDMTEILTDALARADGGDADSRGLEVARVFLLEGMPAGVTVFPRDPGEAARATVSQAGDIARVQMELSKKERHPAFEGLSGRDFDRGLEALGALSESWRVVAEAVPESALDRAEAAGIELEALLAEKPNLILLLESGDGPHKIKAGEYGEIMQIVQGRPSHVPRVVPQAGNQVFLDSYTYQATTRGSRAVDGFLHGKAVYKDTSLVTGYVLANAADIANMSDNDELAAILYVAAALITVSSIVTNPAADIREWGLLPDGLYLSTATLPPGDHPIVVGGREYVLEIPERGQLVALLPALAPGGAGTISQR